MNTTTKIAPTAANVGDIVNHAGGDEEVLEVESYTGIFGGQRVRLRVRDLSTDGIHDFYFDVGEQLTLIRSC